MYISNEELEKIKEYVDNLYWDQDRMSRDGRYFLNKLDNYIKKLEKEKENNIYESQHLSELKEIITKLSPEAQKEIKESIIL